MEYLLKSCGIIVVFYFFYSVFLRKDTFFKCNRLFLLSGLIFAAILPLIIIPIYVEYTPIDTSNFVFEVSENATVNTGLGLIDYLVLLYSLGVLCFLVRFIFQFSSLIRIIWSGKQKRIYRYTYIETKKDISPFSFFNWIVFNPDQFDETELQQILTHEKVHADQYHSIDVLLIELSCITLWFNPFIWLYAKSLKQNLEFLADNTAITFSGCKKSYQYTLLKTSVPRYQMALSNNFYNSLIKKRIVMLHKSKSKKTNQLKFLLITPILVVFLMSFSTKEVFIKKEITPVYDLQSETIAPAEPVIEQDDLDETGITISTSQEKKSIEKKGEKYNTRSLKTVNTVGKVNKRAIASKATSPIKLQNSAIAIRAGEEVIIITKNTEDSELDKIVATQKKLGLDLKFSGVKRNKDGEIIAIKIEASSKKSNTNYSIKDDDAINPIMISYSEGNISIGNAKSKNNAFIFENDNSNAKTVTVVVEQDEDTDEDVEEEIIVIKEKSNGRDDKTIIKTEKSSKIVIKTDDDIKPLFIVDGKELKKSKFKDLDPDNIERINVLKGESAIEKYGNKGKNGVVEVITKKKK